MFLIFLALSCLNAGETATPTLKHWKHLAAYFEGAPHVAQSGGMVLEKTSTPTQETAAKQEPAPAPPKIETEECDYITYMEYRQWLTARPAGAPQCGNCREYVLWKQGQETGKKEAEAKAKKEERTKKWLNMLEGAFVAGILSAVTRSVSDQSKSFLDKNPWLLLILAAALLVAIVFLVIGLLKKNKPSSKPEPNPSESPKK